MTLGLARHGAGRAQCWQGPLAWDWWAQVQGSTGKDLEMKMQLNG